MTRVAKGKSVTERDIQALAQFAAELRIMGEFISEGHTRRCAQQRVFGEPPRIECACLETREIIERQSKR